MVLEALELSEHEPHELTLTLMQVVRSYETRHRIGCHASYAFEETWISVESRKEKIAPIDGHEG